MAAVNFFLGCVGTTQVTRILLWQQSQKNATVGEVAKASAEDVANTATGIAQSPETAARKAIK